MNHAVISIIVPINKLHNYFFKCIDFLFAQTLKNIEVIIVDDNSTDDIKRAISRYLIDPRCKYIRSNVPVGPGGARNIGMNIASGEYIGFCDSDDWVDLNFYSEACRLLSSTGADIAMCSIIREMSISRQQNTFICKYDQFIQMTGEMAFQIMSDNYRIGIDIAPFCTNKIYRRSFLEEIKVYFQEKVYFQDIIFVVETFLKSNNVICVPNVLYHHYRRQNSIIQSFDIKHILDFKNLGNSIKQYLLKEKIYERYSCNYHNIILYYYGILMREVLEFLNTDEQKKKAMLEIYSAFESVFDLEEYSNCVSAKQLCYHLAPAIVDLPLY